MAPLDFGPYLCPLNSPSFMSLQPWIHPPIALFAADHRTAGKSEVTGGLKFGEAGVEIVLQGRWHGRASFSGAIRSYNSPASSHVHCGLPSKANGDVSWPRSRFGELSAN